MFLKCIDWRRKNNIDRVLDEPPKKWDLYKKLVSCDVHGYDKKGRPVYFERVGKIHYPTLLEYVNVDELVQIHIYQLELLQRRARESAEKLKRDVHASVNIVDLDGLSMHHRHGLDFIQRCSKIDEAYYPETMGRLYIINAPRLFPFFWGICKAWVPAETQKKIKVLSSGWGKALKEAIPAHFLPAELGGACECGRFNSDGKRKEQDDAKTCVPCVPLCDVAGMKQELKYRGEEYDSTAHTSLVVRAGSKEEVLAEGISDDGSTFQWNFKTLSKNIETTIMCVPRGEASASALAAARAETKQDGHISAAGFSSELKTGAPFAIFGPAKLDRLKGAFRCPVPCDLKFVFDNSYSWMTSKHVRHRIKVTCLLKEAAE